MVTSTRSVTKIEPVEENVMDTSTQRSTIASQATDTDTINSLSDTTNASNKSSSVTPPTLGGLETLGSDSRTLIQVIQKLEALCISSTLPTLPKFVVVGDQSAGKSSIIEAICDISLPRSQGTCTKCPFQITTKEGTSWSCKITLHRKYDYTPNAKAGKDTTKYDRWTKQDSPNSFDFATVYNKSELEEVLWRAQLAILNPQRNPADFYNTPLPAPKTQVGFSPNIVSIHITGLRLPELSFFDLPGAINVHEDASEQYLVTFVERLTTNYLKDKKALVLLAVACDQDTENSTAFRFIKQCEAVDRCMGVLTKPDLLAPPRYPHTERMLKREKFKLTKGWFVAKSSSQTELDHGVTHAEAREREQTFFANEEPWCSSLASFARRFGVPNLQRAISLELTEHIRNDLPEIMSRVEARLVEVSHQLESFPEQVKAPSFTIINEVDKIAAAVIEELRGDGLVNNFRNQYKASIRELREQLQSSRPPFVLDTPGYQKPSITIDDDDDEDNEPIVPRPTPSKMRKGMDGHPIKIEERVSANIASPKKSISLMDVRKSYERGSSSGIPDEINPKVTERVILDSLQNWDAAFAKSLGDIQRLLQDLITQCIEKCLASRDQTMLYREAYKISNDLFTKIMNQQREVIQNIVACETHKPITYSLDLLRRQKEATKVELRYKRLDKRTNEYFDKQDATNSKTTKAEDRKKKMSEDAWVKNILKDDPYGREVNAMTTPLAYYDIASARVIDTFANHLEYGLIHKLEERLKQALLEGLDFMNAEYCAQLLADDPEREQARRRLVDERRKLEQAWQELSALSVRD